MQAEKVTNGTVSIVAALVFTMVLLSSQLVGATVFQVPLSEFAPDTVTEDFENIAVDLPQYDNRQGRGLPATPFMFPSGVILSEPNPNPQPTNLVLINDFSVGDDAWWGLGANSIDSPDDIKSGTAYLGADLDGQFRLDLPAPSGLVGGWWSADEGSDLLLTAVGESNEELGTLVVQPGPMIDSFIGLGADAPIFALRVSGRFPVLDDFKFEPLAAVVIDVAIDIKPGSCPNPLNAKSQGVLPVAILGTEDFDVTTIMPESVRLEGVAPIRTNVEDVSGPIVDPQDICNCTPEEGDRFPDLTLKFNTQEVVSALGDFTDRENRALRLTGELVDGTLIQGVDCVVILSKGYKGIKVNGGKFTRLDFIDASDIADTKNRPASFIYGLVDMEIEVDRPGAMAVVTVFLPASVSARHKWYKYSPSQGWYDYSANAVFNAAKDKVALTLIDGGVGDDDGVANGVIVVPSGLGALTTGGGEDTPSTLPGSGGGCFIGGALFYSGKRK